MSLFLKAISRDVIGLKQYVGEGVAVSDQSKGESGEDSIIESYSFPVIH